MRDFLLFLAFFAGGFLSNVLAYWVVFRTWKFPRIVVVPLERIHEISKWIKSGKGDR